LTYDALCALRMPICLFDVEEIGIARDRFFEIREAFYDLPWDMYDVRRKQLHLLTSAPSMPSDPFTNELLRGYYTGELGPAAIRHLLASLTARELEAFHAVAPFRRRSASRFLLTWQPPRHGWRIERIAVDAFSQTDAKVAGDAPVDYRAYPRVFAETRADVVESPVFESVIRGLATLVRARTGEPIAQLDVTCHHTYVEARVGSDGDNSPEGIHQDGFDYIVSALVVERRGITGGTSQIFTPDGSTRLLVTTLQPGQGILQPDKGTPLWHNVTPFSVTESVSTGYRTSIGMDIKVVERESW
jgi:hypothetical protein